MLRLPRLLAFLFLFATFAAGPLAAQPAEKGAARALGTAAESRPAVEKTAPYDPQLSRLAEILGSVHYLRTLCGSPSSDWRQSMQQLLDAETANEPTRRERLTAAFNRGYRSFAAVHTSCTAAARTAEERYRNEGATLAAEITGRFGN